MSVSVEGLQNLTFDEFVELPEELHQGAELFDGVVHVTSPIPRHQRALIRVLVALEMSTRGESNRGTVLLEYLVRVNERSGYKPDAAWYPPGRFPDRDGTDRFVAPSIVVEVLSPSTRRTDQVRKPGGYGSIGVDEVWLVDVDDNTVVILRQPSGAGYAESVDLPPGGAITSPLLPGFSLPVVAVFAE